MLATIAMWLFAIVAMGLITELILIFWPYEEDGLFTGFFWSMYGFIIISFRGWFLPIGFFILWILDSFKIANLKFLLIFCTAMAFGIIMSNFIDNDFLGIIQKMSWTDQALISIFITGPLTGWFGWYFLFRREKFDYQSSGSYRDGETQD